MRNTKALPVVSSPSRQVARDEDEEEEGEEDEKQQEWKQDDKQREHRDKPLDSTKHPANNSQKEVNGSAANGSEVDEHSEDQEAEEEDAEEQEAVQAVSRDAQRKPQQQRSRDTAQAASASKKEAATSSDKVREDENRKEEEEDEEDSEAEDDDKKSFEQQRKNERQPTATVKAAGADEDEEEDEGDEQQDEEQADDAKDEADSGKQKPTKTDTRSSKGNTTDSTAKAEDEGEDQDEEGKEDDEVEEEEAEEERLQSEQTSKKVTGQMVKSRSKLIAKAATGKSAQFALKGQPSIVQSALSKRSNDAADTDKPTGKRAKTAPHKQPAEDEDEQGEGEEQKDQRIDDDDTHEEQEQQGANGRKRAALTKATKSEPKRTLAATKPISISKAAVSIAAGKKRVETPADKTAETAKQGGKVQTRESFALSEDAALAATMASEDTGRSRRTRKRIDYNEKNMLKEIDAAMSHQQHTLYSTLRHSTQTDNSHNTDALCACWQEKRRRRSMRS